jgi:hypothetical protein
MPLYESFDVKKSHLFQICHMLSFVQSNLIDHISGFDWTHPIMLWMFAVDEKEIWLYRRSHKTGIDEMCDRRLSGVGAIAGLCERDVKAYGLDRRSHINPDSQMIFKVLGFPGNISL